MNTIVKNKKVIAFILCLFMIIGLMIPQISYADPSTKVIELESTVDKNLVQVGEEFTYTILYAYSSNEGNFLNEKILFGLPDPLEVISVLPSSDVDSYEVSSTLPGVIVNMVSSLPSGTTGFLQVRARFKPGSINETTTITGTLNNDPGSETPASASVPAITATLSDVWTWSVEKTRVLPSESIVPAFGSNVTYRITVRGNQEQGGFPIENVIIEDRIPSGSSFVSAQGSPLVSGEAVQWTIPGLTPGAVLNYDITVFYPEDYATSSAINQVEVTGNRPLNPAPQSISASNSHGLVPPGPNIASVTKWSRLADDRYAVGQEAVFYIGGFRNTGNVPLDRVEVVDTIPDGLHAYSVTRGTASKVYYSTYQDMDVFVEWTDVTQTPPGLAGSHIKRIKWIFEDLPVGFNPSPLQIKTIVLSQYRESPLSPAAVVISDTMTNHVSLSAIQGGVEFDNSEADKTITIGTTGEMNLPWLELTKEVNRPRAYKGETVTYTVRIKNSEYATGPLEMTTDQAIVLEDIPSNVMYHYTYVGMTGTAEQTGVLTGSGLVNEGPTVTATSVDWTWIGAKLNPGEYVDIQYQTTLGENTLVGQYFNTASAITGTIPLDDRTLPLIDTARVFVQFSGSLQSNKAIKGDLDTEFQYSSSSAVEIDVLPGGVVRYRIKVNNGNSNGPITNVVMVDRFPYIGDRGVILPFARGSQWAPFLVSGVTGKDGVPLSSGVAVYYSTSESPDLSKLRNPLGTDSGWTSTVPDLITDVKAIKIEFGDIVFEPNGDPIYVEWDMRVPVSVAPSDYGKYAYNSFAYGATYTDEDSSGNLIQSSFLPAEPVKVGAKLVASNTSTTTYAIGNFIWEDMNKDGVQGVSESGVNGILVRLYEGGNTTPSAFTYTSNNLNGEPGYYEFPNLSSGTYHVEFVMPADYFITNYKTTGDAVDSDFTLYDAGDRKYRASITIVDSNYMDLDAGIYKLGSIGDYVFNDRNLSLTNNSGDQPVSGASIKLLRVTGGGITEAATYWDGTNFVATPTIVTDSTGVYNFTGLDPGEYIVEFTMPNDSFKFVTPGATGSRTNNDSNVQTSSTASGVTVGWTDVISLESGENRSDVDAGIFLGRIGDRVWHDKNGNGAQDDTSSNISGVTVRLYEADGTTLAKNAYGVTVSSVTTNASGLYYFHDLGAGTYVVEFVKPSNYSTFTLKEVTGGAMDSNADRMTGKTGPVVLAAGERNDTIDAGLYNFASLGDYVFNDRNFNGIQDAGDVAVSGASVKLYRVTTGGVTIPAVYWNGASYVNVPDQTTTGPGLYKFTGLDPGTYVVEFTVPNAESRFVPYAVGADTNVDSNVQTSSGSIGWSNDVVLSSGQNRTDVDAGLVFGRIGDRVWHDLNGDGIQDVGEPGIAGVTVQLYQVDGTTPAVDAFGNPVADVITDGSGYYYFNDLGGATYVVKFIAPLGYNITKMNTTVAAMDSNANQITGTTAGIILAPGTQDLTIDAGFYQFVSIGDYVFNDLNANGIQNPGEGGITGVAVTLLEADGITRASYWDGSPVPDIITTGSGFYQFDGLDPGQYRVQFKTTDPAFMVTYPNVGGNEALDSDGIPTTTNYSVALTGTYTLASNESNLTVDQGFFMISPDIDIEKTVYAGVNSGAGIGTSLIARVSGTAVTYMFKITNTGNTFLDDIFVTDAALGITLGGMTIKSGSLPLTPGATLVAYYETTLTNDLINIAETSGTPVYDTTGTAIPGMTKPTDSDTAEAKAVTPGLSVVKMVYSGHDSGAQAGNKKLTGAMGDNITYVFTIVNTSDTFLKDITITDHGISIGGVYLTNGGMTLKAGYE